VLDLPEDEQKQEISFETWELAEKAGSLIHTFEFDVWEMIISPSPVTLSAGEKQKFEAIITNILDSSATLLSEFEGDVDWEMEGNIGNFVEYPNPRTVVLDTPEKLEASSVSGKITAKLYTGRGDSLRVFLKASAEIVLIAGEDKDEDELEASNKVLVWSYKGHIEDKFGGPDKAWIKVPGPTLPPGTYEVEWTFKVIIKPTEVEEYQSLRKAKLLFGPQIRDYVNGIEAYTYKYGYDFRGSPFKFKINIEETFKFDFEICSAYRAIPYWHCLLTMN